MREPSNRELGSSLAVLGYCSNIMVSLCDQAAQSDSLSVHRASNTCMASGWTSTITAAGSVDYGDNILSIVGDMEDTV